MKMLKAGGLTALGFAAGILLWTSGCGTRSSQSFEYMPQMIYTPAIMPQQEGSMRLPPEGTVPRDKKPYPYGANAELAGARLSNPLPMSREVLRTGREYYDIYCMVCHGTYGEGDGTIVPRFPQPPTLQSEKVRGWSDGRLFHVTEAGQNLMPSYAGLIPEDKRWAIVHYIRVIQRAKRPTKQDLERMKTW